MGSVMRMKRLEFYDFESVIKYINMMGERHVYRVFTDKDIDGSDILVIIMSIPVNTDDPCEDNIAQNYCISVGGSIDLRYKNRGVVGND